MRLLIRNYRSIGGNGASYVYGLSSGQTQGGGEIIQVPAGFLLHCDGENLSKTIIDERGHPMQAVGNSQITTNTSKFGGSSLWMSQSIHSDVRSPYYQDWVLGIEPFTIDLWVCLDQALASNMCLVSVGDAYSWWYFSIKDNGSLTFYSFKSPATFVLRMTTLPMTWNPWEWYHVAISVSGTQNPYYPERQFLKMFRNGIEQPIDMNPPSGDVYVPYTGQIIENTFQGIQIGMNNNSQGYKGFMDEIRFVKGQAMFTGNFTPPTNPYT